MYVCMYVCMYTGDAGVLRRVLVVLGHVTNKMSQDQLIKLQGFDVFCTYVSLCVQKYVYISVYICMHKCRVTCIHTIFAYVQFKYTNCA